MKKLFLQSAIEYLTTYSWALLILAIVLIALYISGVFNPSGSISSECVMNQGFSCLQYSMSSSGLLTLNLFQSTSSPINITAVGCGTQSGIQKMQMTANQIYINQDSNASLTVQCLSGINSFTGQIGTLYTGYLTINYTDDISGYPNIAQGSVVVKVTS